MRISDWSSDVCSSDLDRQRRRRLAGQHRVREVPRRHQRGHPDRLPPQLDLGIRQVRGDAHDVGPLGPLGEVLGEGGAVIDLAARFGERLALLQGHDARSEEHTSELQSLMRISYAVFCLKKKNTKYD